MKNSWQQDLDMYFSRWNEGFQTFDVAPIKAFYHEDFNGFWGNSQLLIPDQYGKDYDVEEVLRGMPGAVKMFTPLHFSNRAENEVAVIGVLTATFEGKKYPSQCLYILRHTAGGWKILREYIELER